MPNNENRLMNDKYILRFPDGMRDVLKQKAKENMRSMNMEIIRRLDCSLDQEAQQNAPS